MTAGKYVRKSCCINTTLVCCIVICWKYGHVVFLDGFSISDLHWLWLFKVGHCLTPTVRSRGRHLWPTSKDFTLFLSHKCCLSFNQNPFKIGLNAEANLLSTYWLRNCQDSVVERTSLAEGDENRNQNWWIYNHGGYLQCKMSVATPSLDAPWLMKLIHSFAYIYMLIWK